MSDPFEHIDDYINGSLSPSDRVAFEEAMKADDALSMAVTEYDTIRLIALSEIDAEVNAAFKHADNKKVILTKPSFNRYLIAAGLIGTLVAVLGLMYYLFFKTIHHQNANPNKVLYADLYVAPSWPINRGASQDSLSDAINVALGGKMTSSILMLKKLNLPLKEKSMWISEVFAKNSLADSTLFYLPDTSSEFATRDRINYLRIISLYELENIEEVKKQIQALPKDTDKSYIKIYEQMMN